MFLLPRYHLDLFLLRSSQLGLPWCLHETTGSQRIFTDDFNSICSKHFKLSWLVTDITQNSFTICPKYFSCNWKLKFFVASTKKLLIGLQLQVPSLVWLYASVVQLVPFTLPNYNELFHLHPLHANMLLDHILSHKHQRSNGDYSLLFCQLLVVWNIFSCDLTLDLIVYLSILSILFYCCLCWQSFTLF